MKIFLFFLIFIPSVYGLAVSPDSLNFEEETAVLYLINDRTYSAFYTIQWNDGNTEVMLKPKEVKPIQLNSKEKSGVITISEKFDGEGVLLLPSIEVPYQSIKKPFLNKITGNAAAKFKELNLSKKHIMISSGVGLLLIISFLFWGFPKKKKTKPHK
ncbi:MAG: hypothetical protein AABW49_00175 [Nanoarchaeota archaeon]